MGLTGKAQSFLLGVVSASLLVACSSVAFPYKRYALDLDAGVLRGPKAEQDLNLYDTCKQTSDNKAPCMVFLLAEYEKLRRDYADAVQRLKACEAGR